ncbi:LPS-assembly protein LptD [Salipiger sp. PrR002]|uniref:LPS-assembly protein LptD n=1 Tax=Salipiger sp. PrR002 TaxID=2706489 RepID=UPI0013BA0F9F|nr:LPS assembly protein LptD [Salipiger sp. PrR002]NDV99502.1 LPS-assembly protein LptD [Salipiger sp. PrR002]NDW57148.1 LPS-assembly protein LptD [Salipiger sp. PrR004]
MTPHTRLLAAALALGLPLCATLPDALRAQTAIPPTGGEAAATPALLVADSVYVESGNRLIAQGNVEALQDGTRLTASRIVYDQEADSLQIEGPIRITDASGNLMLAESAELEEGLRNGILSGARMVMNEQLQLAAVEARRAEGRFTQLSRVAVSSCQVCGKEEVPLWSIRAQRVVHDEEAKQIYFEGAQLRVLDVPVFWVPSMRLPDPTLKRTRGFLIPTFRSSTLLGFGVKLPYFVPIGEHQDVTLTPYISPVTKTLEARYRRAFARGDLELNGALTRDTLTDDTTRGYLFAEGTFGLRNEFQLDLDLKMVSDEAYLNDYDYEDLDRLGSTIELSRARSDDLLRFGLSHYQSLRASEKDEELPSWIFDGSYEKRFFPDRIGGELRLGTELHGHYRTSDEDIIGRDVARLTAEASWRKRWTLAGGIRMGWTNSLWFDRYDYSQDSSSDSDVSRVMGSTAVELRWPLIRRGADGARTLLEPVAQYALVGGTRVNIVSDESTRVEFDEGNLLSLSRFPAADRREHGQSVAAGLRWLHEAPDGWRAGMTVGRVWQADVDEDFSRSSGLDSSLSDWLIAAGFSNDAGLTISARGLLGGITDFNKAEARVDWSNARIDLGASYLLLVQDPDEDRDETQSEWSLDGSYRFARNWTSSAEWRYDLADQRLDRAGLGLQYRNECVQVDFSVTRKYASSSNLEPSTDFGLSVALTGFGTTDSAKEYRRTCK